MFVLFNLIIGFVLGFIEGILGGPGIIALIYNLAVLVPVICVGVRRMHDTDHSGWFLLIPIYNLILAVREGQRGDNRFGSDPKVDIAPAAPVTAGSQSQDFDQQLRQLAKLKEDGIISAEEFDQKKKALLGL